MFCYTSDNFEGFESIVLEVSIVHLFLRLYLYIMNRLFSHKSHFYVISAKDGYKYDKQTGS